FIDAGFLAVVYGGVDEGKYLCSHDLVDTLHITGSDKTYDAIVWGETAAERARAKAEGRRRLDKPFTSELGNVTPILVVPGRWSKRELAWQARHVVAAVAHNASFDCVAGKVLVLARGWEQREAFVGLVKEGLRALPPRKAYYPGAERRYAEMCGCYPGAEVLGARGELVVPWTYFPDVPPQKGETALTQEAFCGVLAEVNLDVTDTEDYLRAATRFCNDDVWGTLACFLLTGGDVEARHHAAFEQALEELRYGTIGVNLWPGAIFGFMSPSWGAFPGHTDVDIQSGRGVVHNTSLLDHPQKSVVRSPVRLPVTPPWFADHRNLLGVGQSLLRLEQRYSPIGVALAFPSLLKG
ncbi:MAG: NAD-dependent aldehyde dehydrogenase, partial [Myxococcota bacterium]